ncbi:MAG: class I SAM-dependent methyltransferase [Candidatus Contendobacter sp.]|nr:class I SAM-dependent methyltransferase [Candidatus Contendobacter sp.]
MALSNQHLTGSIMDNTEAYWFGKNWKQFLAEHYSDERLAEAEKSLKSLFGENGIEGKVFLDIGCGSGLFSLAACRLGAKRIISIDIDSNSIECCQQLASHVEKHLCEWIILQGSILDENFIKKLPVSDIVYSWGVLHHTGNMWQAIENAGRLVGPGGLFMIGIYNWQGGRRGTVTWQKLKRWYCRAPRWQSLIWEYAYISWKCLYMILVLRNPVSYIRSYKKNRGMSWFRDVSDWLGGYPYEAATPGEILDFVRSRFAFQLIKQNINSGLGISEFLFLNH